MYSSLVSGSTGFGRGMCETSRYVPKIPFVTSEDRPTDVYRCRDDPMYQKENIPLYGHYNVYDIIFCRGVY